jgi:hypothetical protein
MTFVSPDLMATEDFPTSSKSISVSSAIGDIASVTVTSSTSNKYSDDLCQEPAIDSKVLDVSPVKKRKVQHRMHSATSWIWNHFKNIVNRKGFTLCQICLNDVYYTKDYSTSMLVRHVRRHHKEVYKNHLEAKAYAKPAL